MEEIKVPKDQKVLIQYSRPEKWLKLIGMFLAGSLSFLGYQKIPTMRESAKISEAVQVVKNMDDEHLTALRAVQISNLEKQLKEYQALQIEAIKSVKTDMQLMFKEYDERTTKRLDRHGELILNNIKSIARLEAMMPKSKHDKEN